MPTSFLPPGIETLADIDVADATYGDESVVVQGVVSPSGQSGWPGENSGYKVHCFSFSAWRRLGAPVIERSLTILRPVAPDVGYWDDFDKLSIHRIRVLLSDDETRAIFEASVPMDSPDEELEAIVTRLQQPVVYSTERFGDLVLDRFLGSFEAETDWAGESIRLTFPTDEETPDELALAAAETLWSEQASWNERIERYAIDELLELKNDSWLGEDESEFTAEQFISTMTLTSISIDEEGGFEFWYDDGAMFGGHSITVSGDLKDGPNHADIPG